MSVKKSVNYQRRSQSEKAELVHEILSYVGVGKVGQKKIADIMISDGVVKFKKTLETEVATENDKQWGNFRKEVFRILKAQLSDNEGGLQRITRDKADFYYWAKEKDKNKALALFEMSEPRALAFQFIQNYLSLLLPPHIYQSLELDFEQAAQRLSNSTSKKLFDKVDFNPLGYDIFNENKQFDLEQDELETWQQVFSFTFVEKAFTTSYQSIHADYNSELTLSPQRIVMLNHQMLVLAFVHKNQKLKFFEIKRLTDIKEGMVSFQKVKDADYKSTHKFKAICHTWVKNYLKDICLGANKTITETPHEDCWIIEAEVTFPKHFNDEVKTPDPFYLANYLGMFGDSIAVEEPLFLKKEITRRAKQLYLVQSGERSVFDMVAKSPETMANGNSK